MPLLRIKYGRHAPPLYNKQGTCPCSDAPARSGRPARARAHPRRAAARAGVADARALGPSFLCSSLEAHALLGAQGVRPVRRRADAARTPHWRIIIEVGRRPGAAAGVVAAGAQSHAGPRTNLVGPRPAASLRGALSPQAAEPLRPAAIGADDNRVQVPKSIGVAAEAAWPASTMSCMYMYINIIYYLMCGTL